MFAALAGTPSYAQVGTLTEEAAGSGQISPLAAPDALSSDAPLPLIELAAESYPQALPNDGLSEAEITVSLTADGEPLADVLVTVEIVSGGGTLIGWDRETDSSGEVVFDYLAGLGTERGVVSILVESYNIETRVEIPLAPVAYLDVLLLTPAEYNAFQDRQVAAAAIYKLSLSAFPD